MPIKLVVPRLGKTPNWSIRGTYLGVHVNRSTGTSDKRCAGKILAKIKDEIERGAYAKPGEATFISAAIAYMKSNGEKRFLPPLIRHFGDLPLSQLNQGALDTAAVALYPRGSAAPRSRQVHSPVSAILKLAGVADRLRRPKGGRGARRLFFFTPEQAGRLLAAV
jgi:hypothetical protein